MTAIVPAGLAPTSVTLDNGVRVVVKQTATTPSVALNLALEAGSAHDPPAQPGTAYFLSRLLDRGTTRRPAEEVAEALDLRGVSLRVGVSRQTLSVSCVCLVEDFEAVLSILADLIREPICPEPEVETRRGEVLTAIRQDADSPATMAIERLMTLLYGDQHPYGRPSKGTVPSISELAREDLLAFHRRWVTPSSLSAVVVGDVAPAAALGAFRTAFEGWRAPGPETVRLDPPVSATTRRQVVVPMMSKAQADIAYGFTTVTRDDPEYYAYWLMANIFGQYGLGGRLGLSIRERQGMAYYAMCGFEAGTLAGPLIVRAGVSAANVDRAVASIDREVESLAADGVTEDELANSQRYLVGSLPRTLETNAGIAAFLQNVQLFDLGSDYDQRLPGLITRVSAEAVNAAARRTLVPERAAVVVAGPYPDAGDGEPD